MGDPKRLVWLASLALIAPGLAHAQQSPPSPPPPAAEAPPPTAQTAPAHDEDTTDEIVVLADQGDQVRIDRRTYTLRDDATAQSTNMFDVLGRIPSVSVAPSGAITLLGASNVTIQINGQPVPGANLEQVLRGLPGADVERIEVITNPSAQYSAQASGGIINIITRQRFDAGFNGNVQANADSLGGYQFGVAPSWSRGPWSLSGQVGVFGGEQESDFTRERQDFASGDITTEDGDRAFSYDGWYAGRLQAGYRASDHLRMSLSLDSSVFNFSQDQRSDLAVNLIPTSTRESSADNRFENNQLTYELQRTGAQPRDLLKFNVTLNQFDNGSNNLFAESPAGGGLNQYATIANQQLTGASVKLDIERPLPHERFLTYGAAFDSSDQDLDNALQSLAGVTPPSFQAVLEGTQQTAAAYATYQFATGRWTWLPGVRGENYRREVASSGLKTDTNDLRFFPSLHIRRELTPAINIDLSYTSRIQRPGFQQLDPAVRFVDVNRAVSGNPGLDPTTTDAYEANLVYQHGGGNFSVTFFDRISDDIVSQFTQLTPDGVFLTTPANAGTSEQRGLQALLRGPLGERWRYSLSGNVLSREFDVLSGGVISRTEELEYDGIAQLDWRDPDQNAIGADQLQFELRFQGPRHGLQTVTDEFVMANFTWRRRLTQRLFGVVTVQDIFDSTDQVTELTTDDFFERTKFGAPGTRVRLALTYQFGNGPQRPPQDQPASPPIPVQ